MKITKMQDILNSDRSVKMVIFGGFGIGKTSLLKTLEELTLCLDFEAGLLSVQDWNGDILAVQTWEEARDLACLICGPNPAVRADKFYGKRHHEYCLKKYNFAEDLKRYRCIFIDSITVASRLCLEYAKSMSDVVKTGKPDVRAAYGLMASEIKDIANVEHGDVLMGPDSAPRVVKNVEVCEGEAFLVEPLNGESFILGGENYVCLQHVGEEICNIDLHINESLSTFSCEKLESFCFENF
jgi:hypothetical protein